MVLAAPLERHDRHRRIRNQAQNQPEQGYKSILYLAEQYIILQFDIVNININIGFSKIAISILKNCWQYIANILIEQYIANFEQYIAHFLVDEKIF